MFNKSAGPKQKNEKSIRKQNNFHIKVKRKGKNLKDCPFFLVQSIIFYGF